MGLFKKKPVAVPNRAASPTRRPVVDAWGGAVSPAKLAANENARSKVALDHEVAKKSGEEMTKRKADGAKWLASSEGKLAVSIEHSNRPSVKAAAKAKEISKIHNDMGRGY